MVRPTRFIKGALPGPVEHEMHDVSVHDTHIGESDVGIRIEQHSKWTGSAVVLRRTVLIGAVEYAELISVDERGRVGRGASEIGSKILQENLADDYIDHGNPRNRGSPCDHSAGDGRQQGACFQAFSATQSGQAPE